MARGADRSRTGDLLNAMRLPACPGRPRTSTSVHHTGLSAPVARTVANVHGSSDSHTSATPPATAVKMKRSHPNADFGRGPEPSSLGNTFRGGAPRLPAVWRADSSNRNHRGPGRHPEDSDAPRAPDRLP